MKKTMKMLVAAAAALSLVGALAGCSNKGGSAKSGKVKIALITMDSTDQHWVNMYKGAKAEAKKLGADLIWRAPDKKDDSQQIERINNVTSENVDVIMIAANSANSVTSALEEAKNQGIKLVYVDSPANTKAVATFATNNYNGGKEAAETMVQQLKAKGITKGDIGIVNFNAAATTATEREKGFRAGMKGTAYKVLATQYSDGDASKSQDFGDNFISNGAVGLFGANEGCTVGVGNAIKSSGKTIIGIGFDKSDAILNLVKDGSLYATVTQNPDKMGKLGVEAAVDAVKGKKIKNTNVDTGVKIMTKKDIK